MADRYNDKGGLIHEPSEEIQEAARRLVKRSCAEQGVPEKITDPVVIGKIARILTGKGLISSTQPEPAPRRSAADPDEQA